MLGLFPLLIFFSEFLIIFPVLLCIWHFVIRQLCEPLLQHLGLLVEEVEHFLVTLGAEVELEVEGVGNLRTTVARVELE